MHDILLLRLRAHASYLTPRIHNTKKREEFIRVMNVVIKNIDDMTSDFLIGIGSNRHEGLTMALEVVDDVYENTAVRFGIGQRDPNFYLERL